MIEWTYAETRFLKRMWVLAVLSGLETGFLGLFGQVQINIS